MSRHVIAIEGVESNLPGTWLKIGALWMGKDERLPVAWMFNWSDLPIGYATDLQRDETTHEVSVEISFSPEGDLIINRENKSFYDFSFFATQLNEEQVPATEEIAAHRLILEAHVRGISIIPSAAYPKTSQETQAT